MNDEGANNRAKFFAERFLGAVLLALLAGLYLGACGSPEEQEAGEAGEQSTPAGGTTESVGPARAITVTDITAEPEDFYGERVTVSGVVSELVGPEAFAIGGEELFGGEPLLIAGVQQLGAVVQGGAKEGGAKEVDEGDLVQVTGTVREFKKEEISNKVDYGIDDQYFSDFEGDPAVLATSVVVTPRQGSNGQGGENTQT